MGNNANRRFALAIVTDLEDALAIARQLVRADLGPEFISVIGQETSFADERQNALEFARIAGSDAETLRLTAGSKGIIALSGDADISPKVLAAQAGTFGKMLGQWLPAEHAERLTSAVNRGEFILLVELHSMVDERIATRILLRNCHGSVEVHDIHFAGNEIQL